MGLIDYCELVSGKPRTDLLFKLKVSKQTGRLKVLSESDGFSEKVKKQNYLTVQSPDLMSILSIKLRVFIRICDAFERLGETADLSSLTHSDIRMDLSQAHAAGDSLTRARVMFFSAGDAIAPGEKGEITGLLSSLSRMLFSILFRNKSNNELAISSAVSVLIESINQFRDLSLDGVSEIISTSDELKDILTHNALFYDVKLQADEERNEDLVAEVRHITLTLIRLALLMTGELGANVFELKLRSISNTVTEIEKIFSIVDEARSDRFR